MNEMHDPNMTADIPSCPADSLDPGLAAGFGKASQGPRSSLGDLGDLRPVLLKEAEGESAHVVEPKSDAMPSPEQTGDRYQLQGEIARGGMGAVLRGRDVDLGRDLAVKVLLEKYVDRPEVARRFIEEAQIGGQLQHPGVVPVYDIGRFGVRPFFTMKLVKGQTLAALLGERVAPVADAPGSPKDLPRFLSIALQVAQTIAYAHAKGVIHRDLKPANIMVGAFGEEQVMDWGLAKVLAEGGVADEEKASRERQRPEDVTTIRTARGSGSTGTFGTDTEAGSLLGTPAYMPPEQANGDIAHLDRRADVFGLGAILCEILTGKPPYVGRSSEEVRRKACNGDLADALARLDGAGSDAELIVLTKASLSPEAIDRPRDAQAVADGLTAYLNGVQERLHQAELAHAAEVARTEEAQATAAQERKAKEAAQARAVAERRSRRLTLALAGTVLLALSLGGGGWLWLKTQREARQLILTRDVNDALNKAVAFREQARAAPVGSGLLFGQAREQLQRAVALVESGPADEALKRQVRQLQAEVDEEEKDRQLIAALDEARLAQAEVVASENRFASEHAVPKFREAFRVYGLPAGEGEPAAAVERIRQRPAAVREAIVAALDEWDALAADEKYKITEPHLDWLRAVLDAIDPAAGWTRRFRAARREKDESRRRAALEKLASAEEVGTLPAGALCRLGGQLEKVGAHARAAKLLRRAQQKHPADFWVNYNLGVNELKRTPPDKVEAVRFLTAAVALRPESPGAHYNLGIVLTENDQDDEAIACFKKALALDPKLYAAHSDLGNALGRKGQFDEAIACCNKALELAPKFATAHCSLGNVLYRKGQLDTAIACYHKAHELDPKHTQAHHNLGVALIGKGQVDEAIACFRKAIDLDPKDAQAHFNLGSALKRKGQVDKAIACWLKSLELDRQYANTHFQLVLVLKDKDQMDAAIACFKKAIESNPKNVFAHGYLGIALAKQGKVDEAIACFEKAMEIDPQSADPHFNLGVALAGKGQVDEAIACYQKAIALNPKHTEAHYSLGNALRDKGRIDEAITYFKKAIEIDPKHANAHNCLGAILCDIKKEYDAAIVCFQKAIEIDSKYALYHFNLGNALRNQGKLDEAITSYQKALSLDPKDARFHFNLGKELAGKGQVDEAIACYKRTLELDPKHAEAHNKLGAILCDEKRDYAAAIVCFKKAIALNPKFASAHNNLGIALRNKGRVDEAIGCCKKAIEIDPKEANYHCSLGSALRDKGQPEEAIAEYHRAIKIDPKFAPAHEGLGVLFCDVKRDYDAAIACFKKAIEIDPKTAGYHFNLGNALRGKGQFDEAIASYKKALQLDPNNAGTYCNLGSTLAQTGRFAESLLALKRGHELGTKQPGWSYPSAQWVRRAEELAVLEAKLPAFRKGEFKPPDAAMRIDLASVCQAKKLHAAAARLYADAFAADPKLADPRRTMHRYHAACAAALAGCGQGKDVGELDAKEKSR
jgi:serine/threonine-protein kinase